MKTLKLLLSIIACSALLFGCGQAAQPEETEPVPVEEIKENPEKPESPDEQPPVVSVVNPLKSFSPEVTGEIAATQLSELGTAYNAGANRFALNLLPALYDNASYVASPLSLQVALSMAAAGASGETLEEMLSVLGFPGSGTAEMNLYTKSLLEQLPAVDLSVCLQLADAMIADQDFTVQEQYLSDMESYYYAPVQNMDYSQPEKVKEAVNRWCYDNTHGLIPSILDGENLELATAYLLNALYFKANWTTPFSSYQVYKDQAFRIASGPIKVDYLCTKDTFDYADLDSFQMALLPIGTKSLFNAAILLPKDDNGLEALLNGIGNVSWPELLAQTQKRELSLHLPKFAISSSFKLKSVLKDMGMVRAFNDVYAQFDKIFENEVCYISEVLQKSRIVLDEGGIEAASVTDVEIGVTDAGPDDDEPVYFHADHPFVFIITEKSSGTILFIGVFQG